MKILVHMDIDAFFPSAARIIHPELKNKPIGISSGNSRDVVASASYDARKFGIHAGMPAYRAKKLCPNIVFLRPDFELYYSLFNKIYEFLHNNKNIIIEIASIDEFYIDVSKICKNWSDAEILVKKWQYNIYIKPLICKYHSGISFNKFAAKMATNLKKPYGISVIKSSNFQEKIWSLDINKFYGIGGKTTNSLMKINVFTIKDLALLKYNDINLIKIFGKNINKHIDNANGIGETIIQSKHNAAKSFSKSESFKNGPTADIIFLDNKMKYFSEQISAYLFVNNYYALNISIKFSIGKNLKEKKIIYQTKET